MKIRSDFVSNSSSSSFILDDGLNLSKMNITKDDITDAMCLLMGISKEKSSYYFEVLDCAIEEDVKHIEEHYDDLLSSFYSPMIQVERNDDWSIKKVWTCSNSHNIHRFSSFCDVIRDAYNISSLYQSTETGKFELSVYNKDTQEDEPADDSVTNVVNNAFKGLGIISNLETLSSGIGRFLIHFHDGFLNMVDGFGYCESEEEAKNDKANKKFLSDSGTFTRFNEVLLKALLKIKPNEQVEQKIESGEIRLLDLVGGCFHEG